MGNCSRGACQSISRAKAICLVSPTMEHTHTASLEPKIIMTARLHAPRSVTDLPTETAPKYWWETRTGKMHRSGMWLQASDVIGLGDMRCADQCCCCAFGYHIMFQSAVMSA